jgi:hypothetical protein
MGNEGKKFNRLGKKISKLKGKSSELQSEAGRAADMGKSGKAKRKTKRMAKVDKKLSKKRGKQGGMLGSLLGAAAAKATKSMPYSDSMEHTKPFKPIPTQLQSKVGGDIKKVKSSFNKKKKYKSVIKPAPTARKTIPTQLQEKAVSIPKQMTSLMHYKKKN